MYGFLPFSLAPFLCSYLVILFVVVLVANSCLFCDPSDCTHQAALSMGFPRQKHRSGLPFPSSGDLPDAEIKRVSPTLVGKFFTTEPPGKLIFHYISVLIKGCEYVVAGQGELVKI